MAGGGATTASARTTLRRTSNALPVLQAISARAVADQQQCLMWNGGCFRCRGHPWLLQVKEQGHVSMVVAIR